MLDAASQAASITTLFALGMVRRQTALVAVPDMPARIARVSVSQRAVQGKRRGAPASTR